MTPQPEYTPILVELLARERALFRPYRAADFASGKSTGRTASTRHQLQGEYRTGGLRLPGGGNTAARKAKERLLGDMAADGLVTSGGKERQTLWKLTDTGRWIATALAFQPSLTDGHYAITQLLGFAPAGKLVSELLPAGRTNYGDEEGVHDILWAAELLLPALVAGWCETHSDLHGHATYRVLPEGEAAAAGPEPIPPDDLPAEDDELIDHYWESYRHECDRLTRIPTPDHNDIAPLPLSAGLFCNVVGPWNHPFPSLSEESANG